ncbi:MAG: PilN domain-containing protein [Desulfotalea sp.]
MLRINLLPVRQLKRRAEAKQQIFLTICLVLFVVFICSVFGTMNANRQSNLSEEIARLKSEEASYAPILKKIRDFKSQTKELGRKKGIIEELKNNSSLTVHIMDEVSNSTAIYSKRIWINSYSQQGNSLSFSGVALDNRTISDFMKTLKKSSYINSVNLSETSQQSVAGRNLKKFSLNCAVSSPKKDTAKTKKS